MRIKSFIKDWLLPKVLLTFRSKLNQGIRFEGDYSTWLEAKTQCAGYDADEIIAKVLESTLIVKRGGAAFERDSVLFHQIEYVWPVTASLMWAAAQTSGRLDLLDFGGALGSSYFQNKMFLANLPYVKWSVVEQANFVEAGCKQIQDETLRFYASIDNCTSENKPNIVLLSGVLQCIPEPNSIIKKLGTINADYFIIDRTPFFADEAQKTQLVIQKVPPSLIASSYPVWLFEQKDLLMLFLYEGYEILAKWDALDSPLFSHGRKVVFKGFLLKRK